ncbi:putative spermidine/putrescine transport system ATP-binding protein [Devosia crocina]|uniref:Putative spermidine/putrescine transport system ATP-binding protein n=1 Tax=Devosia crocina TaxID=429728 RepID=A0A1I7MXY9_9HYPH|nr:ABC transporter ATP-binding protein [Devosia crocina]SFV27254.1 putative spermidine/putrescine transport system ATP-binding protein [Devosia crocina]
MSNMSNPTTKLSIRGLSKTYNKTVALQPVDLEVKTGELLTLLGPSGSGKTTLLQLISGLVDVTTGNLVIDGVDQTDAPVHQRDIGVVFQSYALFPHLTVRENIAFPLQMRKVPADEIKTRVDDALAMVGLAHAGDRSPRALSGGQQQRVALARCLVYRPSVILMDEPLGALDRKLREVMQDEIKRIHRETGATIIFVTHDQEEALALSDRICLMNNGQIEQVGTPREMYEAPQSVFVADFIGVSNIFSGTVENGQLRTDAGLLPLSADAPAETCAVMIRPEDVILNGTASWALKGTVVESTYAGSETRVTIALDGDKSLIVRRPAKSEDMARGLAVTVSWDQAHARYLTK